MCNWKYTRDLPASFINDNSTSTLSALALTVKNIVLYIMYVSINKKLLNLFSKGNVAVI